MQKPRQTPPTIRRRIKTIHVVQTADASPSVTLSGPEMALPIIAALYADLEANKEHFLALALNTRSRVIGWSHVSTGSINASIVHPRELFSAMLRMDAVAVILVHNHPSGEVTPSNDDVALTARLTRAGDLLGITVLDHLIIGPVPAVGLPNWLSMKAAGLM